MRRTRSSSKPKPDQFRWLKAIRVSDTLKNQPGALRLAMELADLFNPDKGFAFPSRDYLANELGSDKAAISTWTTTLRECGAITTLPQGRIHLDLRTSRDPRSLVFILEIPWADAVLALHESQSKLSGKAPPRARSVVGSTTDPVVRSATEVGGEVHNTYNLSGQTSDNRKKRGDDEIDLSVYARGLGEELPLDPPETTEEAVAWLRLQGLSGSEIERAAPLLKAGKLYRSQIERMKSERRRPHERAA